jgi:spermidine synthase
MVSARVKSERRECKESDQAVRRSEHRAATTENEAEGIWLEPSGAGTALVINGTVQSVSLASPESIFGYWPLMLPTVRPEHALILGLGGGTLAQLLLRRFGPTRITGIDIDERVIALASAGMGLDTGALRIVVADAFTWVETARERFDYVAIDLFRGGEVPRQAFSTRFLRGVRGLMAPRGMLVANLAKDEQATERIARLGRLFRAIDVRKAGKNLIVHGQAPRR